MKRSIFTSTIVATGGLLLVTSTAQAQHSYLPAQDSSGQIYTFIDQGAPTGHTKDRVISNLFDSTNTVGRPLNAARSGAPSGFLADSTDARWNDPVNNPGLVGFSTLTPNTDLTITNPVLSNSSFGATGNALYWDGTGGTPNFGAMPTNVRIDIGRLDGSVLTPKASLDGGLSAPTWVEDTSNALGGRSGHFHLQYDVYGDAGGGSTFEAPDGIYLLGHIAGMAGLTSSDVLYSVMLKNVAGDLGLFSSFSSAIGFLETQVVPEPTAGLLLAVGAGMTLIGRRRNRSEA